MGAVPATEMGIDAAEGVDVGVLFDAHAPFLARVVERLSGAGAHVEDIVQETFVVAHRRRQHLASIENLRGWLYRTAANLVRHHHRGAQRRTQLSQRYQTEARELADDPAEVAQRRATALLVRSCVAELSDKLREVMVLYEFEGLAGREIAAMLELPEKTVWSRLRLARKQFERLFTARAGAERKMP